MPNIVRIKRRISGNAGAPGSLKTAELAYNMVDNTIYAGFGDDGSGNATSVKAVAGDGTFAVLASPAFTGSPTAPTANADTNTTQVATTAFVIGQASSTNPVMNGTAAVGTSLKFARADHVHPTDTSRAPLASPALTGTPTAPTAATADSSTQIATTAFVKNQSYITGNQSITLSGDASGTGSTAITVTLASVGTAGTYTKVTTNAKGLVTGGASLAESDIPTLTAAKISNFDTQVRSSRLDQMAAPTAAVGLNSQRITGLADPTNAQDAATKAYVDATKTGLDVKDSVRVASTANQALTGGTAFPTIDGVATAAGNRVLLKDQTNAVQNGIYVVGGTAGAWTLTRATDADTSAKVTGGMFTFVEEGTQADTGWVLTTNNPITLDTTALNFTQFSGAGEIVAGAGLTKSGVTLDVGAGTGITVNANDVALATSNVLSLFNLAANGLVARTAANTVAARTITGTADRITVTNGDAVSGNPTLDIATSYVGQTSITTLGTIATGTWNATAIGAAVGGTGQTTYAVGDLLYASASNALAKLTAVATGNALISGGANTAPSWGKIGLTTHVSGTLPVANGGTGAVTFTAGALLKGNGTSAISVATAGSDYHDTNSTIDGGTF